MQYELYAVLRDSDESIMIVAWDDVGFMERLIANFQTGNHIVKFVIMHNNEVYLEKELPKAKVLKKTRP